MARDNRSSHWMSGLQRSRPNDTGREIETKVVGVTFDNRQAVISRMSVGEQVWLRRDPTNPHDRNAIRVERWDGTQVGFISRYEAAELAHIFDAYGKPVAATVTAIMGGSYHDSSLGVRIKFVIPLVSNQTGPILPSTEDIDNDLF